MNNSWHFRDSADYATCLSRLNFPCNQSSNGLCHPWLLFTVFLDLGTSDLLLQIVINCMSRIVSSLSRKHIYNDHIVNPSMLLCQHVSLMRTNKSFWSGGDFQRAPHSQWLFQAFCFWLEYETKCLAQHRACFSLLSLSNYWCN